MEVVVLVVILLVFIVVAAGVVLVGLMVVVVLVVAVVVLVLVELGNLLSLEANSRWFYFTETSLSSANKQIAGGREGVQVCQDICHTGLALSLCVGRKLGRGEKDQHWSRVQGNKEASLLPDLTDLTRGMPRYARNPPPPFPSSQVNHEHFFLLVLITYETL